MQKAVAHSRAVLSRILFLGLSVQILLGLFWLGGNAGSMICILTVPAAFVAGYCMVKAAGVKKRFWQVWGSLALLTFPMAMQCHGQLPVDSLGYSCFLVMLAGVIEVLRGERTFTARYLLQVHFFWFLASLFLPEYFWFGIVPLVVLFFWRVRKLHHFLVAVAFAGLIFSVSQLSETVGLREESRTDLRSAWFRRTTWSSLADYYQYWPQEVRDAFSVDELSMVIERPEKMQELFQPRLEERLGKEQAGKWYGEFAGDVFGWDYRLILAQSRTDLLSYIFPPIAVQMVLEGRGYSSRCFRNYELMREAHPLLTKYYMDYSAWWLAVGLAVTAAAQILYTAGDRKKNLSAALVFVVAVGVIVVWYTFQEAGLWDYTKALPVGGLWMLWMVLMAAKISGEKQDE